MHFSDFNLTLASQGDTLTVSTVDSASKRVIMEMVSLPFTPTEIELLRTKVESEASKTTDFRDEPANEAEHMLRVRGIEIFNSLFPPRILKEFRHQYMLARDAQQGLRVRVCFREEDQHLGAYPIEAMYWAERDASIRQHLALFGGLTIVRSLGESVRKPKPIQPPLRVFVVVASPKDLTRVDSTSELSHLQQALKLPGIQGFTLNGRASLKNLIDTAVARQPHILHFIGHGHFDQEGRKGFILLEDRDGRSERISGEILHGELSGVPSLRLVTLNACLGNVGDGGALFSAVGTSIASIGIPAVVAMQYKITNIAATEFSRHFYGQLALGRPVDEAMSSTRRHLRWKFPGSPEWATPVLYLSTADGDLFGLKLPADELLAHAKEHLRGASWETARTIAMLLREQHSHDQSILCKADALAKMADDCERFMEQWLPIQEAAKHEDFESLGEQFQNLLELVSGFAQDFADTDSTKDLDIPQEIAAMMAAVQAFAKEDFASVVQICDRIGTSNLIDPGFLRGRATAEFEAWNEMRRLTEIWNGGDWIKAREIAEGLDLRGTQQQRVLDRRKNVARELGRVTSAIEGADFKRAQMILERLPPEEAPANIELARRIAAIGVEVMEAIESGDSKAITNLGEKLEAFLGSVASQSEGLDPQLSGLPFSSAMRERTRKKWPSCMSGSLMLVFNLGWIAKTSLEERTGERPLPKPSVRRISF